MPGFRIFNSFSKTTDLIRGLRPPDKPELIMTIGLPGCGKTTYAENLRKDFPERKYNILGSDYLTNCMKVGNLPRREFLLNNFASNSNQMEEETNIMTQEAAQCF